MTPAEPTATRRRAGRWLPLLAICVTGWLAHGPSLPNPFVFDDMDSIVGNPDVHALWPPAWLTAADHGSVVTRPLTNLTLAASYAVGGDDPRGYRAVNLALHLVNALLLFLVLRGVLTTPRLAPAFGAHAGALALLAALLWLAHPLQTQVIDYIVQRSGLLMTAMFLGALLCVQRHGRGWTAAAIGLCAAGMLSKESMAGAPLLLPLYDHVFGDGRRRRVLWAGLALTWLPLAGLMWLRPHGATIGYGEGVTAWAYLLNQALVIPRYLWLIVWPHPLILDYGPPDPSLGLAAVWPQALLVLVLLAATAWALRRRPEAGFAMAWFFLWIAPTSSVVPLVNEVAAERRIYLAMAGPLVLLLGLAWRSLRARRVDPRLGAAVGAALVVACVGASRARHGDFVSARSIWQATVDDRPGNPRAHSALAMELAGEGQAQAAADQYRQAIALRPGYADAYNNLGMVLMGMGKPGEAIQEYEQAIRYKAGFYEAHNNLGAAYSDLGRWDEAIAEYGRALVLRPEYATAQGNLGMALEATGQLPEAIAHYEESLRLDPDQARIRDHLVDSYNQRGIALEDSGAVATAIERYRSALAVDSTASFVHYNLGLAYESTGRLDEAAASYRQALRWQPDYAEARQRLDRLTARAE